MSTKDRDYLLIAGVPATGKSYFSRWLAANHGYTHVDIDSPGSDSVVQAALRAVNTCSLARSRREARAILSGSELPPKIVLDWGFDPREDFAAVKRLKNLGFRLFWFDGDRAIARAEFIRRNTVPVELLDVQMPKIERDWERIRALFGRNMLHILSADGTRIPPEKIWQAIRRNPKLR